MHDMDKVFAQPIHKRRKIFYLRKRFQEWKRDSLLFYPFIFMLVAVLLVLITRQIDHYLTASPGVPDLWLTQASSGVNTTALVASSVLSLLAIVFSISLVALQLSNQQFSPLVITIFERADSTKVTLSLFIATFVYSFILLIEVQRASIEKITVISLFTNILLIFACLIVFIVFMKSIMLMIRVTYIITIIAEKTREAIQDNLPPIEAYVECLSAKTETPCQIIRYTRPPSRLFIKRYAQGVFRALEYSTLVEIAANHHCTLQVYLHFGDYVNQGDPIVAVYGDGELPVEPVLKAFYVEPSREIYQDPAFGIRMLVDIALQALSQGAHAPSIAHQVIFRLTNLLAMISQRPEHSGFFADNNHQIRVLHLVTTWEEYVELAFSEIAHYGKNDPQTVHGLTDSLDYLLGIVPEALKPALENKKMLVAEFQKRG